MRKVRQLETLKEISEEVARGVPSEGYWRAFRQWVRLTKEVVQANVNGYKDWFVADSTLYLELSEMVPLHFVDVSYQIKIVRTLSIQPYMEPKLVVEQIQKAYQEMSARASAIMKLERDHLHEKANNEEES